MAPEAQGIVGGGTIANARRIRIASGTVLIAALMLLPQVSAATRFGASSGGATDASSPCHANVSGGAVPVALGVDIDDVVQIWFNYTYYDNRTFDVGNPVAIHTFNLTTLHDGLTQDNGVPSYFTIGGGGGSSNDVVNVVITDNTANAATIEISWTASITVGWCSASDSVTHTIHLGPA